MEIVSETEDSSLSTSGAPLPAATKVLGPKHQYRGSNSSGGSGNGGSNKYYPSATAAVTKRKRSSACNINMNYDDSDASGTGDGESSSSPRGPAGGGGGGNLKDDNSSSRDADGHDRHLDWRLHPSESFSDWKIEITIEEGTSSSSDEDDDETVIGVTASGRSRASTRADLAVAAAVAGRHGPAGALAAEAEAEGEEGATARAAAASAAAAVAAAPGQQDAAAKSDAGERAGRRKDGRTGSTSGSGSAIDPSTNVQTSKNQKQTYHVHKCVLSFGPRRCNYFSRVFAKRKKRSSSSSKKSEKQPASISSTTTRFILPKLAADAFPRLLDFAYGNKKVPNILLDVDPKCAAALYALGDRLGNKALRYEVKQYIKTRLDFSQVHLCYRYAARLRKCGGERTIRLLAKYCARNINRHDAEDEGSFIIEEVGRSNADRETAAANTGTASVCFSSGASGSSATGTNLVSEFWLMVLEEFKVNRYGHISCAADWILEICRCNILKRPSLLSYNDFEALTSDKYLPKIPTQDVIEFLTLEERVMSKNTVASTAMGTAGIGGASNSSGGSGSAANRTLLTSIQQRAISSLVASPQEWIECSDDNDDIVEYRDQILEFFMDRPKLLTLLFTSLGQRLCLLENENTILKNQYDRQERISLRDYRLSSSSFNNAAAAPSRSDINYDEDNDDANKRPRLA